VVKSRRTYELNRGPAIDKPVHRDWNVINEPGLKNQEGRGSDGCPLCAKRVGSFTYDFFKKSRLLSFQFKTSLFKTTILLYHHLILTSFIKHDPHVLYQARSSIHSRQARCSIHSRQARSSIHSRQRQSFIQCRLATISV
jgi:hypothetical protein